MQVAGFQAGHLLRSEAFAIQPEQAGIHGQHQLALRLQVAQAHLHQIVRQLPGAIDLAVFAIDQVQTLGELLLRVERHREADRQRAGTIQLHLRDIHHGQLAARVTLGQRFAVDRWLGSLAANRGGLGRRHFGGPRGG